MELAEQNNLFIIFHRYFIDPRGLKRTCNFFNGLPFFYLVVFLKTKLHDPPLEHKIPSNL